MRMLVTGGCGFIGSHMVDRLIDEGYDVLVIDNLSADCHDEFYFNDKAQYVGDDISEYWDIEKHFINVDTVFHFAAEARIQPCINQPTLAIRTNTLGTSNVLTAARDHGVRRVLNSSSSSIYGSTNPLEFSDTSALRESMPNGCLNPYSISKMAAEEMCRIYYEMYGLQTITFRYFNVYGPREPVRGEYAPVVGKFLRQHNSDMPMTVIGDGLQRRDFTHVCDIIEANYLASQVDDELAYGEIFNIGAGKNYSILELVNMIGGNYVHAPERPGEARETLSCTDKAQAILGWKPTVNFAEYIRDQIAV